ncbi:MAG: hypothetical protein AAGF59_13750, partial [Pseudomonadota bacterium]
MTALRKPFRIERAREDQTTPLATLVPNTAGAGMDPGALGTIMKELTAIKAMVARSQSGDGGAEIVPIDPKSEILKELKAELAQAAALKSELDEIYEAINKTKREIASLHVSGFEGADMNRVTDELDAVVLGTESSITSAALRIFSV